MKPDSKTQEQESEFIQLVRERYDPGGEMSYEDEHTLLFLLNAPEQYEVEPEIAEICKGTSENIRQGTYALFPLHCPGQPSSVRF